MAPVGCAVAPPISGQLSIEGIPVLGLVDTGASVTCLGFAIWWRYRAQWGALKQFEGTVHGAHGKPLNIAGRTEHLDIQWVEASFIVIVGLESPPCLIGMDIMRPLRIHIDVTNGMATPAQPDPQTIHLNAAQSQQPRKRPPAQTASPPPLLKEEPASGASLPTPRTAVTSSSPPQRQKNPLAEDRSTALPPPANLPPSPTEPCPNPSNSHAPSDLVHPHTASCARLLQTADIPPETARLVHCHNPWLTEDVLFYPDGALPTFVTGIPALSSGPELWYAVHNHRPEPLQLHAGWCFLRKDQPPSLPPHILQKNLVSHHSQSASPRSSSSSSMSCLRSSRTSSARVTTTWVILHCWSMGLRPIGPLSASPTGGRTPQFAGKK